MVLFHPKYGHTELQLKQLCSHARIMLDVFDTYELELTGKEEETLKDMCEKLRDYLEELIEVTEESIEVDFLERKMQM